MKKEQTTVDIDFAEAAVPQYARRGIVTMFMIMLGFTFFSASMWVGQELADGLDFGGFSSRSSSAASSSACTPACSATSARRPA